MLEPLKTELRVDACVIVPYDKNHEDQYISGRIHEVNNDIYMIELLIKEGQNASNTMIVEPHKMGEFHVVYSAWCSKCWIAVV